MAKAMAKTKEKAHPYQEHIDALRKKQSEHSRRLQTRQAGRQHAVR